MAASRPQEFESFQAVLRHRLAGETANEQVICVNACYSFLNIDDPQTYTSSSYDASDSLMTPTPSMNFVGCMTQCQLYHLHQI